MWYPLSRIHSVRPFDVEMPRYFAFLIAVAAVLPAAASAHRAAEPSAGYPSVVNFGRHALGETSEALVTIRNDADATIRLGPAGISSRNGDPTFGMTDPDEGACFASGEIAELAPGQSCSIIINFTPPAPGRYRAELSIGVDGSATISIKLMGSGARN